MFPQRMLTWLVMVALLVVFAGCGGGGEESVAPTDPTMSDAAGGDSGAPPMGDPGMAPPGDPAMAGDAAMMGDPAMAGGAAPPAGGGGGSGGAPSGVDPAKDLAAAKTLLAMGREFMKIEAYDLALTAYQDSAKYETGTAAQAKRGVRDATAKLKASFREPPPPPRVVARAPGYGQGYPGGPEGLPAPGMDPAMAGAPPGMEGMPGGPGPMPDMAYGNAGYQVDMPPTPPTAIGF